MHWHAHCDEVGAASKAARILLLVLAFGLVASVFAVMGRLLTSHYARKSTLRQLMFNDGEERRAIIASICNWSQEEYFVAALIGKLSGPEGQDACRALRDFGAVAEEPLMRFLETPAARPSWFGPDARNNAIRAKAAAVKCIGSSVDPRLVLIIDRILTDDCLDGYLGAAGLSADEEFRRVAASVLGGASEEVAGVMLDTMAGRGIHYTFIRALRQHAARGNILVFEPYIDDPVVRSTVTEILAEYGGQEGRRILETRLSESYPGKPRWDVALALARALGGVNAPSLQKYAARHATMLQEIRTRHSELTQSDVRLDGNTHDCLMFALWFYGPEDPDMVTVHENSKRYGWKQEAKRFKRAMAVSANQDADQ